MSALNQSETEVLDNAQRVIVTASRLLERLKEGEQPETRELDWLLRGLKISHNGIKTIKTMKGYYPK